LNGFNNKLKGGEIIIRLIDQKIQMYKDALEACGRKRASGLDVGDDTRWLNMRLKQLKREKKQY